MESTPPAAAVGRATPPGTAAPAMGRAARLPLLAVLAAAQQALEAPVDIRSPGCGQQWAPYVSGLHEIPLQVTPRKYMLFLPTKYLQSKPSPLWILAPGAYETAERFLYVSGMLQWAETQNIAFAALESAMIQGLNVGLHSQPVPRMPDDVEYTRTVLRDVSHKLCIDMDRIRCVGYSRGARFCSRLASELSSFVKGIAPVAGVRYPLPNNASWPMPIIAVHGTHDRINPYWGVGDPSYWNASVPVAINMWASFNGCKYNKWARVSKHVVLHEHFDCRDDASVVLVMIESGGHTWPGSKAFEASQFGKTTMEISANQVIQQFFLKHPRKTACHTARQGELCYEAVQKAAAEGVAVHPEWAPRINGASTFEDYQALLHDEILADCPRPCNQARQTPPAFRYV